MQLNQPIPPTYSGDEDPYDFILKGNQKPKKTLLPSGNSRKSRILLVVGGVLAALFLLAIIFALVTSSGSSNAKSLLSLAQDQNEIIRISNNGGNQARDPTIQGFSQTVTLVLTTSQQKTVKYLNTHGVKTSSKSLALTRNAQTDATLKSADEAGRYDAELLKTLEGSLNDYKSQLNEMYKKTSSKSQKILLQQLYNQAVNLTKNQPTSS